MKLLLAAAPLLVASTALARSPLIRGQTTDLCANLDVDLVIPDADGKPYNAGHIDVGVCVSQVKTFIGHYSVTETAAKVVGADKVEAAVVDLIKKAGVECSYPPHATPSVTRSNECDFVCADGFLAMPTNHPSSCICPPHMTECNGQCGDFRLDCSTTRPPSRRENDSPKCAESLMRCGVPDGTAGKAYKCTDIMSDSYTCGGCVKASPFDSPSMNGVGINCHNIPHVDKVTCGEGKCVVHTCKSGFTVSASKDTCVADVPGKSVRGLPVPNNGHVLDAAGMPLNLVKGETEMITPGAVAKKVPVPRTDMNLGAAHEVLEAGKVDTKVPRSCTVDDDHC